MTLAGCKGDCENCQEWNGMGAADSLVAVAVRVVG